MRDGIREISESAPNIDRWRINQTTTLAAGFGESSIFQFTTSRAMMIAHMHISAPAPVGAASGDHGWIFRVFHASSGEQDDIAELAVPFNQPFLLMGLYLVSPVAPVVERPAGALAQISLFKNAVFDRDNYLLMRYVNRTNVSQTGMRIQKIFYRVFQRSV